MTTLRIDPAAQLPPYEQLRRQLIDQMRAGYLPSGTKLPAVRRLAVELGIAPGTVARAYKELEAEGYLIARGRHGTIVAPGATDDPDAHAQRLTGDYIAAMRALNQSSADIIAAVRSAVQDT